jgi:hypothetical protein
MKKKTSFAQYDCQSALNVLPTFLCRWIAKHNFPIPLRVPVRRNCMTGSGTPNMCHFNVDSLAQTYGGYRLTGYLITNVGADPSKFAFIEHSVWITPEGKAVDVTAHNFETSTHVVFIPLTRNLIRAKKYINFLIKKDFLQSGVSIVHRDPQLNNSQILIIPSSKFNRKLLTLESIEQNAETVSEWKKKTFENGGFSQPSTCTGKYWNEIKRDRFPEYAS